MMSTQAELPVMQGEAKIVRGFSERTALALSGVSAMLAGACCLGPLVLVTLGFGGAWLSNLQVLEPYQPVFIAVALAALGWSGWRIYRPAACEPGEVCSVPWMRRSYRIGFWIVAALLLVVLGFPYVAKFFY
jgi:mercuric ion transport protein